MSERAENMGRRVELRQSRKRLAAECDALRESLRRALPLAEDAACLDGEKILNSAVALNQSLLELNQVDRKLSILNRELGD